MGNRQTGTFEQNTQSGQWAPPPGWTPQPAYGSYPGQRSGGSSGLKDFLTRALQGGFQQYGGQMTAGLTSDQMGLLSKFFGAGGGFDSAMSGVSDIAQQDALGRAEMMMRPSTERAMDQMQRRVRERMNLGGMSMSTGAQEIEANSLSDILNSQNSTLAGMIPQLTQLKLQAAQSIPQMNMAGLMLGDFQRQNQQSNLDALYREYLRTTPSGGPLQAMLQFNAGRNGQQPQFIPDDSGGGGSDWGQMFASMMPLFAAAFSSDEGVKTKPVAVDEDDILQKITEMPVSKWSYKNESGKPDHVGPMAQDFKKAFGLGKSDKTINVVDAIGVLMAGMKALAKRQEAQAA